MDSETNRKADKKKKKFSHDFIFYFWAKKKEIIVDVERDAT